MSDVPNPFKRNDVVIKLEDDVKKLSGELESLKSSFLSKEMQCDTLAGKLSHQETVFKEQIQGAVRIEIYREGYIFYCFVKAQILTRAFQYQSIIIISMTTLITLFIATLFNKY